MQVSDVRLSYVCISVWIHQYVHVDRSVILFDGICNFCNEGVNFFLSNDADKTRGHFRFAALQGDLGQALLKV